MDEIDRKIIELLADDGRRSLADIGAVVGLSTSAVNERIRRLVATGAIRRFTIDADPDALGLGILAFVWVGLGMEADEAAFRAFASGHRAVIECHHVTGPWSYLIKARLATLDELEAFLAELKGRRFIARSETIIGLSTVVDAPLAPRARQPGREGEN